MRSLLRRRQHGQAMIEYLLVLPLLVGLVVGTVGIGRVLWCDQVLQALASDAARAGALGSSASDARARATARAADIAGDAHLDPDRLELDVDTTGFGRGGWVVVAARYAVIGPVWLGQDHPQPFEVQATAREPVDRYRSGVRP